MKITLMRIKLSLEEKVHQPEIPKNIADKLIQLRCPTYVCMYQCAHNNREIPEKYWEYWAIPVVSVSKKTWVLRKLDLSSTFLFKEKTAFSTRFSLGYKWSNHVFHHFLATTNSVIFLCQILWTFIYRFVQTRIFLGRIFLSQYFSAEYFLTKYFWAEYFSAYDFLAEYFSAEYISAEYFSADYLLAEYFLVSNTLDLHLCSVEEKDKQEVGRLLQLFLLLWTFDDKSKSVKKNNEKQ